MDEREIKVLINSIERLLGNPLEADAREVEELFTEFGDGKAPAETVLDLASRAAQKYRLSGESVPIHVAEAVSSARRAIVGGSSEELNVEGIVEAALNPILGPVREVSYAFRNRKGRTQRDADLLERLSGEVKKDWSEDKGK
jgi:hypothetical protein